jgi:NADPH2:quinone reductase
VFDLDIIASNSGTGPASCSISTNRLGATVVSSAVSLTAYGYGVNLVRASFDSFGLIDRVYECSTYSLAPAARSVRLPDEIDARTAAAAMLKGLTVEFLIRRLHRVAPGETILFHAGAGGVGQIAIQWAKALGATVITTVGSEAKAARARELGADHVILYRDQDVAAEVRRITGGAGVPIAYDSVGRDTFEGTLASLAKRGMFVSFGNASGPPPPVEAVRLMRSGSLFFTRPTLNDYHLTPEEYDDAASALFQVLASGEVKIEIGQTFALADARLCHEALESRATVGASLLIP